MQVCGQSKGKVLSEPLLALGVRGVDGGVSLCFRRAAGAKITTRQKKKKEKKRKEKKKKRKGKQKTERKRERQVRGEARGSFSAALHMTEWREQCP